jgi:DNA-binding transcriptional LysR family regulator
MHLDPAHWFLQLSRFHQSANLRKRMELRDIEYFAIIAEHRNVRRASEALGLSPGAMSKSLRRLEKSMHAKLVERTPKGVALTSVGAALLAQVHRLRVTLMDIRREAEDLTEGGQATCASAWAPRRPRSCRTVVLLSCSKPPP